VAVRSYYWDTTQSVKKGAYKKGSFPSHPWEKKKGDRGRKETTSVKNKGGGNEASGVAVTLWGKGGFPAATWNNAGVNQLLRMKCKPKKKG